MFGLPRNPASIPRHHHLLPGMLVLPGIVAVVLFYYFPLFQTFVFSFFSLEFTTEISSDLFVGLQYYQRAMGDSQFLSALGFTLAFSVATISLDLSIGMILAIASFAVHQKLRWLIRSMIIVPWAIPPVIQASMWRWFLNSDAGPLGDLLVRFGFTDQAPLFLAEPLSAMASVIFAFSWKGASITSFFFMGALAMIPQEVVDSAKIDGAGVFRRFIFITIPMILPTIFVTLLYRSQDALRVFDIIYGLTGGGPGTSTETLSSFAYTSYFRYAQFGRASAYSIITFLFVAGIGSLYIKKTVHRFNFSENQ